MTDAERWDYFTDVMKQLEALSAQAPQDRELSALTMRANNAINRVLEHCIPDREEDDRKEAAIAAAILGHAEAAAASKDDDPALAAKVEKFRERMAARVAEIKGAIMAWLQPRDRVADSGCITTALLEIALDRHVWVHRADGFDLIQAAYSRAVQRWQGTLQ